MRVFICVLLCSLVVSQENSFCYTEEYGDIIFDENNQLSDDQQRIIITLRTFIHIIKQDNGSGGISHEEAIYSHQIMESNFQLQNIRFELDGINEINSTGLYYNLRDTLYRQFITENIQRDRIDIFIVPGHSDEAPVSFHGGIAPNVPGNLILISGDSQNFTFYTEPPNYYEEFYMSSVLSHEMGHCLGLYHTHRNNCTESIDGSNCEECGDLVCDTPAAPGLTFSYFGADCNLIEPVYEPETLLPYNPDIHNFMSYNYTYCLNRFSPRDQHDRMFNIMLNSHPNIFDPITVSIENGILGCTDSNAINFDPEATENDFSCFYNCDDVEITPGDLDGNGSIDTDEINTVAEIILGEQNFEQSEWCNADYNDDGNINVLDIVGMVNVMMGGFVQESTGTEPIYISRVTNQTGDLTYRIDVDIYSDQLIRGVQIKTKAPSGKKITSISKSQQVQHMNFGYSISKDSTEASILFYGIEGQVIENGLKSLFSTELIDFSGSLNRSEDDGEFTMVGLTNDGIDFLDYEIVSSEDLGRIAQGEDLTQPFSFALNSAFPNPFNPKTTIGYEIGKESLVELSIINIKGQIVEELVHEVTHPGIYNTIWNAKDMPSGIYMVRLKTPFYSAKQKIILLK